MKSREEPVGNRTDNSKFRERLSQLREEASKGVAIAQFTLCTLLLNGSSLEQEEASHWLEEAADQGHARALYLLAMHKEGKPYAYEYDAENLLFQSAKQGYEPAKQELERRANDKNIVCSNAKEYLNKLNEHKLRKDSETGSPKRSALSNG